jgi:hemin uptake protein HemP
VNRANTGEIEAGAAGGDGPNSVSVIDSARLFAGRREIQIRHQGKLYRLLITKNGKLILNK